MTEPQANPYNAKKTWHSDVKENDFVDSNSLFVPKIEATESPSQEATPQEIEEVNWKKRYDDLKTHYDSKVNAHKQEIVQVKAEVEVERPSYTPPKTVQELEEFKAQNPDIYAVVESVSRMQMEDVEKKLDEVSKRDKLIRQREAYSDLIEAHPDFEEIKEDPEFHAWAKTQEKGIQDWIFDNPYNGALAARAIDLYKADKGIVAEVASENTPPVDPNVSAASLVPTRTSGVDNTSEPKIWSRAEIKALSLDDYDQYEDDIHKAMREGRIRP